MFLEFILGLYIILLQAIEAVKWKSKTISWILNASRIRHWLDCLGTIWISNSIASIALHIGSIVAKDSFAVI